MPDLKSQKRKKKIMARTASHQVAGMPPIPTRTAERRIRTNLSERPGRTHPNRAANQRGDFGTDFTAKRFMWSCAIGAFTGEVLFNPLGLPISLLLSLS